MSPATPSDVLRGGAEGENSLGAEIQRASREIFFCITFDELGLKLLGIARRSRRV
jgi:hypothetical protein